MKKCLQRRLYRIKSICPFILAKRHCRDKTLTPNPRRVVQPFSQVATLPSAAQHPCTFMGNRSSAAQMKARGPKKIGKENSYAPQPLRPWNVIWSIVTAGEDHGLQPVYCLVEGFLASKSGCLDGLTMVLNRTLAGGYPSCRIP